MTSTEGYGGVYSSHTTARSIIMQFFSCFTLLKFISYFLLSRGTPKLSKKLKKERLGFLNQKRKIPSKFQVPKMVYHHLFVFFFVLFVVECFSVMKYFEIVHYCGQRLPRQSKHITLH